MKINWPQEFDTNLARIETLSDNYPWHDANAYAWWLAQTYYLVRHTTRFIALTAARVPFEQNWLHYKLMEHCREESGHDALALNDIQRMGFSVDQLAPLPETTALYRAQYYALEYGLPVSHFGYSFCFEGYACRRAGQIRKAVEAAHGKGTATFLAVHAVVDQDHFAEAFQVLDKLSPAEGAEIRENLILSCYLYEAMMKRLIAEKIGPVATARPLSRSVEPIQATLL
jgi:hypothetical protein